MTHDVYTKVIQMIEITQMYMEVCYINSLQQHSNWKVLVNARSAYCTV